MVSIGCLMTISATAQTIYDSSSLVDTNNVSTSTSTVNSNSTNNNINSTTVNSTSVNTNVNQNSSTSTNINTNNNNNTGHTTSDNINTNNNNNTNVNTSTSENTNRNINTGEMTNRNINTGEMTNRNINTGEMTNRNIAESDVRQKIEQPPPTAIAPAMMSGGNNDLCTTGSSGAVQTQIFGMSFGTTNRDLNCERLKLSKTLYDMGMKVAAVATMCQDPRVFAAMMAAGTPCPIDGKIGEQARAEWERRSVSDKEENIGFYATVANAGSCDYKGDDPIVRDRVCKK
jgi:hypothetical protein